MSEIKEGYALIKGRVEGLEYTLHDAAETPVSFDEKADAVAPILSALAGNGGLAVGSIAINSLYKPKITREKNKLIIEVNGQKTEYFSGDFYVRMTVNGAPLNGRLKGICFKDGDTVDVVTNGGQGIVAVANPDDRTIVMPAGCYRALGSVLKESALVSKWIFLIGTILAALVNLCFYIFGDYSAQQAFSTLGIMLLSVVVVSIFIGLGMNRSELGAARKTSRIFSALGWKRSSMVDLSLTNTGKKTVESVGGAGAFYFY